MTDGRVQALWKKPKFTRRILNFIFDEGHCISQWGSFRKEYRLVGNLRHLIPDVIPFYVASATFPEVVLLDVVDILHLRLGSERERIIRSNDRPDLRLYARQLVFPANSYQDLRFLIPEHLKEGDAPLKFLVFFDRTKDTEAACRFVRTLLPENERGKLKYFHATMTGEYREKTLDGLQDSDVWGIFCTDACGMVS
jgi:ATP-dependent DNA helicase RecQ